MNTMADFIAIRCEEPRSIQDTFEARKCFSDPGQADSSCHVKYVHVSASIGGKNANDRLNDLFAS